MSFCELRAARRSTKAARTEVYVPAAAREPHGCRIEVHGIGHHPSHLDLSGPGRSRSWQDDSIDSISFGGVAQGRNSIKSLCDAGRSVSGSTCIAAPKSSRIPLLDP
jgi:hypothetical protein